MKKNLLFGLGLLFAITASGQRISNITFGNAHSFGYYTHSNPTNVNKPASPVKMGVGTVIFPEGTDLSNLTDPVITAGEATVATNPIPTNWTSPVNVIVETETVAAGYDIEARILKPTTLPITGLFTAEQPSNAWTSNTMGWALAGCGSSATTVSLNSAGRGFMLAFSDAPEKITYSINLAGATDRPDIKMLVEGSADGTTWNVIKELIGTDNEDQSKIPFSNATPAQKIRSHEVSASTRFVRFLFVIRASENITIGNVNVDKSTTSLINATTLNFSTFVNNGVLTINSEDVVSNVQIVNFIGQVVLESNTQSKRINISSLPKGSYVVRIAGENNKIGMSKFIN